MRCLPGGKGTPERSAGDARWACSPSSRPSSLPPARFHLRKTRWTRQTLTPKHRRGMPDPFPYAGRRQGKCASACRGAHLRMFHDGCARRKCHPPRRISAGEAAPVSVSCHSGVKATPVKGSVKTGGKTGARTCCQPRAGTGSPEFENESIPRHRRDKSDAGRTPHPASFCIQAHGDRKKHLPICRESGGEQKSPAKTGRGAKRDRTTPGAGHPSGNRWPCSGQ